MPPTLFTTSCTAHKIPSLSERCGTCRTLSFRPRSSVYRGQIDMKRLQPISTWCRNQERQMSTAQPFIVRSYIISLYEAKNTFYITEPRSRKLRVGPAIWTTRCMLAKIVCKAFMLGKRIKKTNYVDFELFIVFSYRISKIQ